MIKIERKGKQPDPKKLAKMTEWQKTSYLRGWDQVGRRLEKKKKKD